MRTDDELVRGSSEPAELIGHGPIPADEARDMVRKAANAWVRRLYRHPDSGALVAMDSRRRKFAGQLRRFLVLTDQTCRNPWCDAPVRHLDHVKRHADGGSTASSNGAGLCEACNFTKNLPGWEATLITTSDGTTILDVTAPTGHRYRSRSPGPPDAADPTRPRIVLDYGSA